MVATQNPFYPYQPAEGRLFANRKLEQLWFQQDLIPSLEPDSLGTYNAAILGPWGIGKSSLVRQLRYLVAHAMPVSMAIVSCTTGFGSLMGFSMAIVTCCPTRGIALITLGSGCGRGIETLVDRNSHARY